MERNGEKCGPFGETKCAYEAVGEGREGGGTKRRGSRNECLWEGGRGDVQRKGVGGGARKEVEKDVRLGLRRFVLVRGSL